MPDLDKGFPLPEVVDPPRFCIQVQIPNERNHIAAFVGNFLNLGYWFNWQRDDDKTGLPVSQIWFSIIQDAIAQINLQGGDCVAGCDCIEFNGSTPYKFVPSGTGGGSFQPIDPRTEGALPPPWTIPPVGQSGNCLSAANIMSVFKTQNKTAVDLLAASAEFITTLVGLEAFLGLVFPPIGEVIAIATSMVATVTDAGATIAAGAFIGTNADTAYAELQCLFSCAANSDGSFSSAEVQKVKNDLHAYMPGPFGVPEASLFEFFADSFIDAYGPNGLTGLGAIGGITSADCSTCDCGWESVFDFATSDYSSFLTFHNGTWVAGKGYVSAYGGSSFSCSVSQTDVDTVDTFEITSMELFFDAVGFSGSNSSINLVTNSGLYGPAQALQTGTNKHVSNFQDIPGITQVAAQINTGDSCDISTIKKWIVRGNGTKPSQLP